MQWPVQEQIRPYTMFREEQALAYQINKGPGQLYYRPLQPSDFHSLKAAHSQLFPIDYDDVFYHKATQALDRIFSLAAVWRAGGMMDCSQESVVGFVTARVVRLGECETTDRHCMGLSAPFYDSETAVYILTLGVVDGFRNRGIASNLIAAVYRHSVDLGCRAVFLHVITYNDTALRLYARHGFHCAARLPHFYVINSGRQADPSRTRYDAFLYVVYVAPSGAVGGAAGQCDVLALTVQPVWHALSSLGGCLPWQESRQQLQPQSTMLPPSVPPPDVPPQHSSGGLSHKHVSLHVQPPPAQPPGHGHGQGHGHGHGQGQGQGQQGMFLRHPGSTGPADQQHQQQHHQQQQHGSRASPGPGSRPRARQRSRHQESMLQWLFTPWNT